jgi:hypothetical protein
MEISILAARDAIAQARIIAAAEALAKRYDLAQNVVAVPGNVRDPKVRAMQQREQLADLLEAVVAVAPKRRKAASEGEA